MSTLRESSEPSSTGPAPRANRHGNRVTVTRTRTEWSTRTQTETITEDSTTTAETTRTVRSTRHTTISNIETGTVTETETVTITREPSADRARRNVPDLPAPTSPEPAVGEPSPVVDLPGQVFVVRPAASLDALANALARRGVTIERRATETATEWRTVQSVTTEGIVVTTVDWHTEWKTTTETDITTETTFMNAKETETETTTRTRYVTAAVSSKEETTESSTESSADPTKSSADSSRASTDSTDSTTERGSTGQNEPSESASTAGSGSDSGSDGPSLAAIIGGAVGGAVGLILIALVAAYFLWNRRMKQLGLGKPGTGGMAQSMTSGTDGGPPFMLPSEPSVSPLAQGAYSAPGKGPVAAVQEYPGGGWGPTPTTQEMSNTPTIPPAQLATSPQSGLASPHGETMPSQFSGSNGGYESFDYYSQGYYMPPSSQPSDIAQELYSPDNNMNAPPGAERR